MAEIISGAFTTSENDSIEAKAKGVALVTEGVIEEFLGFNNEFDLNELQLLLLVPQPYNLNFLL